MNDDASARDFDAENRNLSMSLPALALQDVRKRFGASEIIGGVSLAVQPGERVAVIGPNGAGKSTLFDLISGRTRPDGGQIWLHGARVDGKRPFEINRMGLSRSFQVSRVFGGLSVQDNLRCAALWALGYRYSLLRWLGRLRDVNQRADELLERTRYDKNRPLLQVADPLAKLEALYAARDPLYRQTAHLVVEAGGGNCQKNAAAILHMLQD